MRAIRDWRKLNFYKDRLMLHNSNKLVKKLKKNQEIALLVGKHIKIIHFLLLNIQFYHRE